MKKALSTIASCAVISAMITMRTTGGIAAAQSAEDGADSLFPEYRAVVIYTAVEGGPEMREVFGEFENLQECLVHAQARRQAMVLRKELYGGEHFCLYLEDEKAKPKLLR